MFSKFPTTSENLIDAKNEWTNLLERNQKAENDAKATADKVAAEAGFAIKRKRDAIDAAFQPFTAVQADKITAINAMRESYPEILQEKATELDESLAKYEAAVGAVREVHETLWQGLTSNLATIEDLAKAEISFITYKGLMDEINAIDQEISTLLSSSVSEYQRDSNALVALQKKQKDVQDSKNNIRVLNDELQEASRDSTLKADENSDATESEEEIIKQHKYPDKDRKRILENIASYENNKYVLPVVPAIIAAFRANEDFLESLAKEKSIKEQIELENANLEKLEAEIQLEMSSFTPTQIASNPAEQAQVVLAAIDQTKQVAKAQFQQFDKRLNDKKQALQKVDRLPKKNILDDLLPYEESAIAPVNPVSATELGSAKSAYDKALQNHSYYVKATQIVSNKLIDLLEQSKFAKNPTDKKRVAFNAQIDNIIQETKALQSNRDQYRFTLYKNELKNIIIQAPEKLKPNLNRLLYSYDGHDNDSDKLASLVDVYNSDMCGKIQGKIDLLEARKKKYINNTGYTKAANTIIQLMTFKLNDYKNDEDKLNVDEPNDDAIEEAKLELNKPRGWTKPSTTYSMGLFKSYDEIVKKDEKQNIKPEAPSR